MKLYEIKDWDKIKLKHLHMDCEYLKWDSISNVFFDEQNRKWCENVVFIVNSTGWEVYEEPNKISKENVLEVLNLSIYKVDKVLTELKMIKEVLIKEEL
jgi:hypothetical protein